MRPSLLRPNCPFIIAVIKASRTRLTFVATGYAAQRSLMQLCAIVLMVACSLPSTATATDLAELYQRAKNFDAQIQAARYEYEAAVRRLPIARSAFRPQIGIGANASLSDRSQDEQGSYTGTELSIEVSQSLFDRANSALINQTEFDVLLAESQYAAQQQNLILRVAQAYFDVLRAQANVEFSQSELQAIGRQREQAERRFDVGLVPITDVRDAQAQFDLAIAQEIAASNQLSTALEALRVLSGSEADILAPIADDLPLLRPEPDDIDSWVDTARGNNLELNISRMAVQSANSQVDIERGSRYPTVSLVAIGSRSRSDLTRRLPDNSEVRGLGDIDSSQLRLQLSMPIYTGGRIKAQVAQAQAQALSATERLVAQERATVQQTRDGYRGVIASISQVRALRQALISTEKSAEATEAGFRAGTRTSVDVLRALRDTFSAQSDFAGARYDYILNSLNLKFAAGTLSEDDLVAINNFLVQPGVANSE